MTTQKEVPPLPPSPPFFSVWFHARFLPMVLRYAHNRDKGLKNKEIPWAIAHFIIILTLLVMIPNSLGAEVELWKLLLSAVTGWLPILAIVTTIIEYIARRKNGYRYTYKQFSIPIFTICILLGLATELITVLTAPTWVLLPGSVISLALGYIAGIFAGVWVHATGYLSRYIIALSLVIAPFVALFNILLLVMGVFR